MTGINFKHTVSTRRDSHGYDIEVELRANGNVEFFADRTWRFAISHEAFEDFATVVAYIDKLIKGEIK